MATYGTRKSCDGVAAYKTIIHRRRTVGHGGRAGEAESMVRNRTEGQDLGSGACGDLPLSECLEGHVGLARPIGVDCHFGDVG